MICQIVPDYVKSWMAGDWARSAEAFLASCASVARPSVGKETIVSSFARLKCTPLRFGLAEIHLPFVCFTGKESKQAFLKTILGKERG